MTNCLECQNLSRVYESKLTRYLAARSAVLYRISTELAAKQQVDMERAKNGPEDHLLICPSPLRRHAWPRYRHKTLPPGTIPSTAGATPSLPLIRNRLCSNRR